MTKTQGARTGGPADSTPASRFRTCVVALDGSEMAEGVLPYAVDIALNTGGTLVLVRIVSSMEQLMARALDAGAVGAVPLDIPGSVAAARAEAQEYLAQTRERLWREARVDVRLCVTEGDPASGILDLARDAKADLIALSTHGRSGVRRVLFGSVAEAVIRRAVCPVLVVPSRVPAV